MVFEDLQTFSSQDTGGPRLVRFHLVRSPVKYGFQTVLNSIGFLNSTVPWGRKNSTIWGPPVPGLSNNLIVSELYKYTLVIHI